MREIDHGEKQDATLFSQEQRVLLRERGYQRFTLTGQTIVDLRKDKRLIWGSFCEGFDLDSFPSLTSEVAVNPQKLLIPESKNKSLKQQLAFVKNFGKQIAKEVPGCDAILGAIQDYAMLSTLFFEKTGTHLFASDEPGNAWRARTSTLLDGSGILLEAFQDLLHDSGPVMLGCKWPKEYVGVIPLIVPSGVTRKIMDSSFTKSFEFGTFGVDENGNFVRKTLKKIEWR